MKKSIMFGLALSLLSFFASAGGDIIGNGGDAVVCTSPLGEIESVEVLDVFEAKASGLELIFVTPDEYNPDPLNDYMAFEHYANRVGKMDKDFADFIRYEGMGFRDELLLQKLKLTEIEDTGGYTIPANCKLRQVAIQAEPVTSYDKRYRIDLRIWKFWGTNFEQKTALMLHEIVYRYLITKGFDNSKSTRKIVGLILADQIKILTKQEYKDLTQPKP